jgi:FtsZ-binding cell division protein ZapB
MERKVAGENWERIDRKIKDAVDTAWVELERLRAEIEELKEENEALKKRVEALEARGRL